MNVERVSPLEFAGQASRILREAWVPPSILYTAEYLRWQFGFPAKLPPLGVAAFEDREAVGFAGAAPRPACYGGERFEVYLVSFVAVRPGWRGRDIAAGLYRELLGWLKEFRAPVVTFAEAESPGERCLKKAYAAAGLQLQPFGNYPVYGSVGLPTRPTIDAWKVEEVKPDYFLVHAPPAESSQLVGTDLTSDVVRHSECDPRRRAWLVARRPGQPLAAARAALSEVQTVEGVQHVPMIDAFYLPQPDAGALRALLRAAARHWVGVDVATILTVPNSGGLSPDLLREAGLRRTARAFHGYRCDFPGGPTLAGAAGTNLEVV